MLSTESVLCLGNYSSHLTGTRRNSRDLFVSGFWLSKWSERCFGVVGTPRATILDVFSSLYLFRLRIRVPLGCLGSPPGPSLGQGGPKRGPRCDFRWFWGGPRGPSFDDFLKQKRTQTAKIETAGKATKHWPWRENQGSGLTTINKHRKKND